MAERRWRHFGLSLLLAITTVGAGKIDPVNVTPGAEHPATRNFVLLRHAEKETGVQNPGLTRAGHARANFIADWWGDPRRKIKAVWSSNYRRTRETARPLAEQLGVQIRIYDAGDLPALAARLRDEDVNAVVIGHSNTTPRLAALLCDCEVPPMEESDYERAYQVFRMNGEFGLLAVDFRKAWSDRPAPAE
jgi:phosphohistidine phosphatase SixA